LEVGRINMSTAPDNSAEDTAVTPQPEKVDRATADSLNNYAQKLDDPITHVVDYGGLDDGKKKK
jgi:hypothetical protein